MLALLLCFAMAADTKDLSVKNEGCKVACLRSGYDGGKMADKGCVCFVYQEDYELFTHGRAELKDIKKMDPTVWDYH